MAESRRPSKRPQDLQLVIGEWFHKDLVPLLLGRQEMVEHRLKLFRCYSVSCFRCLPDCGAQLLNVAGVFCSQREDRIESGRGDFRLPLRNLFSKYAWNFPGRVGQPRSLRSDLKNGLEGSRKTRSIS